MAGIRFLDKEEVTLNFITSKLLEPDTKKVFFDDIFGFDDIYYLLKFRFTKIYGIHEKGLPEPIGVVMFTNCVPYRDCTLWAVIFDKKDQRKGHINNCYKDIKKDLIQRFSPHSITSYVIGKNPASEHILKKLGFEKIGTKVKYKRVNGKYEDFTEYYLRLEV